MHPKADATTRYRTCDFPLTGLVLCPWATLDRVLKSIYVSEHPVLREPLSQWQTTTNLGWATGSASLFTFQWKRTTQASRIKRRAWLILSCLEMALKWVLLLRVDWIPTCQKLRKNTVEPRIKGPLVFFPKWLIHSLLVSSMLLLTNTQPLLHHRPRWNTDVQIPSVIQPHGPVTT